MALRTAAGEKSSTEGTDSRFWETVLMMVVLVIIAAGAIIALALHLRASRLDPSAATAVRPRVPAATMKVTPRPRDSRESTPPLPDSGRPPLPPR